MALCVTDCRRWQLHALSQSRLPFSHKRDVPYFGRWQGRLRSNNKWRVKVLGRLQRNSCLRTPSELNSRRSVTRGFSEFGFGNKFSAGGEQTAEEHRPPFDLDLAVLLAGFAFESYNTPAKNVGVLETDGRDCETTYLSREFIRSIYDGQLFVNLQKGAHFPGLDLWGTSDPYVVLRIGDCSVRSRTIWANKDPFWNENLTLNIKTSEGQNLQVAAWDANIVTSERRMGNTSVRLDDLCDGKRHSLELDLEGMGGGGRLFLEVQFKSFAQIEAEKNPFSFATLFGGEMLANAYKSVFGDNGISVGDFMSDFMSKLNTNVDFSKPENATLEISKTSAKEESQQSQLSKAGVSDPELEEATSPKPIVVQNGTADKAEDSNPVKDTENADQDGEVEIWTTFAETLKPFGIDISGFLKDKETWEVGENVKSLGVESQKKAEFLYAESGLVIVEGQTEGNDTSSTTERNGGVSGQDSGSVPAGKEVLEGLIRQTEGIVGAWAIFNNSQGGENQGGGNEESTATELAIEVTTTSISTEDEEAAPGRQEEVEIEIDGVKTTMFSTAESAMEAWALLATTMGGSCFVKSDFEKISFVENKETDTQVALWRDLRRHRIVVAFRGTEQTKWKDVVTDLSLLAAGFNPERVTAGSNFKDEPLVHSGFLKAYDSVKARILSLLRASIDSSINPIDGSRWQIFVTGHSLGGALATLFALELSSSRLAKSQNLGVTMYNYGSPRVGNRVFAEKYNKIVKNSWRVVNHRDIVPTVPRLMGYCHVAQPIYLAAEKSPVSDLLDDGYNGDVIGEATPDIIIDTFMKGEQTILQKLLDTEISMLRAMRDGSAVMQHMEDFYYITLLQRVESRIRR
ncbi:unnamed protein product [Calypogeia fissa]